MQHEEGGCNVESQVPPDNSHVDCNAYTSFRDLLTVVFHIALSFL